MEFCCDACGPYRRFILPRGYYDHEKKEVTRVITKPSGGIPRTTVRPTTRTPTLLLSSCRVSHGTAAPRDEKIQRMIGPSFDFARNPSRVSTIIDPGLEVKFEKQR